MMQTIIRHLPSELKNQLKNTPVERWYHKYRRRTEETSFKIPCGELGFEVIEGGTYTHPDTWAAEASYPEPVIVDEFCDILGHTDVFYNIGAMFGYYSCIASVAGVSEENIYSFEPKRQKFQILKENTSDEAHNIQAFIGEEPSSPNSDVISLDSFVRENYEPTVVKMDIQGHEYSAISGMHNILETHRPRLYIEMHPELIEDGGVTEVLEILDSKDYNIQTINHRSKQASWSEPTPDDLDQKGENGVDYYLRGVPE
jgi:hypothetical protein